MTERKRPGRKLLIASIGVASVSYVACAGDDTAPGVDAAAVDSASTGAGGAMTQDAGAKDVNVISLEDALVANLLPPQQ